MLPVRRSAPFLVEPTRLGPRYAPTKRVGVPEIKAVEDLVQVARDAATEHLDRATKDLHLGSRGLVYYKDLLDGSILNARSTLARCRELASVPSTAIEASPTSVVQGLLAAVRESLRLLYVAMAVLERAESVRHVGAAHAAVRAALRSCSFCGKTEAEAKLVAGPLANICGPCTRLACGVLGITLSEDRTE